MIFCTVAVSVAVGEFGTVYEKRRLRREGGLIPLGRERSSLPPNSRSDMMPSKLVSIVDRKCRCSILKHLKPQRLG